MTDRAIGAEREDRAPAADWRRMRPILLLPPALALAYPFLLKGFNASVFVFLSGADEFAAWSTAAVTLLRAFGIPIFARKGSRPRAVHDQRTQSTYLFGAVCPELGTGAALVLPACNSEAIAVFHEFTGIELINRWWVLLFVYPTLIPRASDASGRSSL